MGTLRVSVSTSPEVRVLSTVPLGPVGPTGPPFMWRGTVATFDELPGDAGAGDVWTVDADGHMWQWDGESWVDIGESPVGAIAARDAALVAQGAAEGSASAAAGSALAAAGSADAASLAQSASEVAQSAAEGARDVAVVAAGDAEDARDATIAALPAAIATRAPRRILDLPGSGNYLVTPPPPQLAGATELDIRVLERPPAYGAAAFLTQANSVSTNISLLATTATGSANITFRPSTDGTNAAPTTRTVRPAIGAIGAWRFTWRASDGRVQAFTKPARETADLADDTGWTQVGNDGTSLASPLFASTSNLAVNAYSGGGSGTAVGILGVWISTEIDGTPFAFWRADSDAYNPVDAAGTPWQIVGTDWSIQDDTGLALQAPGTALPAATLTAVAAPSYMQGPPAGGYGRRTAGTIGGTWSASSLGRATLTGLPMSKHSPIDRMGVLVVTPGDGILRLGLYLCPSQTWTGTSPSAYQLVADFGEVGLDSAGVVEAVLSAPVQLPGPGVYIAAVKQVALGGNVRGVGPPGSLFEMIHHGAPTASYTGYRELVPADPFPATVTPQSISSNSGVLAWVR